MGDIFELIDKKKFDEIKKLERINLSQKKCKMDVFEYAISNLYQGNSDDLKILIYLAGFEYNETNHYLFNKIDDKILFILFLKNYKKINKIDIEGNPLWFYLIKSRFFIQEKLYENKYSDIDYSFPNFRGNYVHSIVFYTYIDNKNITADQLYNFYMFLIQNNYEFNINDENSTLIDILIKNDMWNETITNDSIKTILLLFEYEKSKNININLIKKFFYNFYESYITMPSLIKDYPSYNQNVVNKILNQKMNVINYKNINEKDKIELIGSFYKNYVNLDNEIYIRSIHPIIHSFDVFLEITDKIIKKVNKNNYRLVVGESLNKIMYLFDNLTKTNSNYIAFSGSFYLYNFEENKLIFNKKKYDRFVKFGLDNYKILMNKCIKEIKDSDELYIFDFVATGKGILSFLHLFRELYPKEYKKIHCVFTYSEKNHLYKTIKKEFKKLKIKTTFIEIPYVLLKVFYDELYEDRCIKKMPISKFTAIHEGDTSDEEYPKSCNLNKCNLMKFYILDQLEKRNLI